MFYIKPIGNPEQYRYILLNDNCIQVQFLQKKSIFLKLSKALKRLFSDLLKKVVTKILRISLTLSLKYGGLSAQEITALDNITGQAVTNISHKMAASEDVETGVTITLQKEPYRKKLLFSDIEKIRLVPKSSNDKNCLILVPSNSYRWEDLSYQMSFGAFKRLQGLSSNKLIMPATSGNEKGKPNTVAKISSIDQQKSLIMPATSGNEQGKSNTVAKISSINQQKSLYISGDGQHHSEPSREVSKNDNRPENPQPHIEETFEGYVPLYKSHREIAAWAEYILKEDVDLLYRYIGSYQAEYLNLIYLKSAVLKDAEIKETSVRQSHKDECNYIRSIKPATNFNPTIKKDAIAEADRVLKSRLQYIKNEKEDGLRIVDNGLQIQEQKRVQLNRCLYHLGHALIKKIEYSF